MCGIAGIFNPPRVLLASELKGLHASRRFRPKVDRGALALYLRYGRISASASIFQAVQLLAPGSFAKVTSDGETITAKPTVYWSVRDVARRGFAASKQSLTPTEWVDETHARMRSAVAMRMQADVPLGAFLSGGIDSSLIVALMQSHGSRAVRTFSVGFDDPDYDESHFARAVATHLGAQHTEIRLDIDEGMKLVSRLAEIYDEPFADRSRIPTFLVSEFARRDVAVCPSGDGGDGGDEVFGGYNHYRFGDVLWKRLRYLSPPLGALLQKLVRWVPYRFRAAMIRALDRALPHGRNIANSERKFERILSLLGVRSREELYFRPLRGFGAYDVSLDHARAVQRWFGQSSSWAQDLFASSALECEGLVDSLAARQALTDHLSGRQNHPHLLWTLLMSMAWRERWQV